MSREKIDLLRAYGAEVVVAPTEVPPDSAESYYRVADRLTEEISGAFQPNQYQNPANPETHYLTTGPEIWDQTAGSITHFVVGVGTGGTISGAGKFLKEQNPEIQVIGADPSGSIYSSKEVKPYLVEGIGEDFWPSTFDPGIVDRYITVSDKDSFVTTRKLAQSEALLVGGSSGTAAWAALKVAAEISDPDAVVVVVLPDGGRSYLSKIYNDAWMSEYGFLDHEPDRTVGDVLRMRVEEGLPRLVTVGTHNKVKDAIDLFHEFGVSQLPVVSSHDEESVVGSVGEKGLLRRAVTDNSLLNQEIVHVMEAPFPAVAVTDRIRQAVELLSNERQALLATEYGKPVGILTRADLLEALVT